MKKLINVSDFIDGFTDRYSPHWFSECQTKFEQLPYNLNNHTNEIIAPIRYLSFKHDGISFKIEEEKYTLYDFCYGLKDIYLDDFQENKFKTIGELPNGYPEEILIEGEEYANFLPEPSLNIWKIAFVNSFDKDLSMLVHPTDKSKYFEYQIDMLKSIITNQKTSSHYASIITEFINTEIIKHLEHKYEREKELSQIIYSHETKTAINFDLTTENFCKLFLYLVKLGIIEYDNKPKALSDLLSKGVKIKIKSKFVSPNPASLAKGLNRAAKFIRSTSQPEIDDFISSLSKS